MPVVTTARVQAGAAPQGYEGRVDEDAAVAYALATNDRNERYLRGEAVPPLYTSTLILPAQWQSLHNARYRGAIKGATGSVHGEHDVFYWGPVLPGMGLQWDADFYGAAQTPGGVLAAQRILVSGLDGTPLVEHYWSSFYIGGRIDGDIGQPLPEHAFPPAARTHPVASRTLAVERDQAFRYAGVSGDHAGHAIDDEIARREGHPGKILQGMCTFAMCSGALVDVAADGDPGRLRRLAGRFSSPAFPRKDLVVSVYDAGRTEEGGRAMAFEASQDGVVVIKHGRVELVPD